MQGSLSEFRLAEILQLVAVQQKTGLLRLTRANTLVTFYFDTGTLVAARDRRHTGSDPLLAYLVRVGWVHPDAGTVLRTRLDSSREDLADILLAERYMSEDEVHTALEDLAQELVHHTFGWRDGTYQFIGGDEALAGLRHRVHLKIDAVLMEGARRADEWPRLLERLPGPDVIFDLSGTPTTSLGAHAHELLGLVQGAMRLGDLVRQGHICEFEVYEIVAHAAEAGVVRILETPEPAPAVVEPVERPPAAAPRSSLRSLWTLPRPLGWSMALAASALALGAAAMLAPRLQGTDTAAAARVLEMESARESVRRDVEIYRALHGRYPATLTALAIDDLASAELLHRAGPLHYAVTESGKAFELSDATHDDTPRR